jgi:3-dehydroquinate dehydratase-2
MKVLILHGPNLNLLGEREPEIYGSMTLPELNTELRKEAKKKKIILKTYQSNHEGELIDQIHAQRKWADAIVINPGAYTHYSYALRDAISSVNKPTIEVHLSDIHAREDFRKISVIAPVCIEQISGLGWKSYLKALERLSEREKKNAR